MVGVRPSEEANRAAELAVNFGGALGVEVPLVLAYERHAVTKLGMGDPHALVEAGRSRMRAREALSRLCDDLRTVAGSRLGMRVVLGDAATGLKEVAEEG